MMDEQLFRREADKALENLKQALIDAEDEGGFETEENNGVLNVVFDAPKAKFVFTPNTPVRQIWISALSTSFKLEWVDGAFKLPGVFALRMAAAFLMCDGDDAVHTVRLRPDVPQLVGDPRNDVA